MFEASALLTVRELADRLRVSLATAYQLLKLRKIPPLRVGARGGSIRVRASDVEQFMEARKEEAAPAEPTTKPVRVRLKHLRLKPG